MTTWHSVEASQSGRWFHWSRSHYDRRSLDWSSSGKMLVKPYCCDPRIGTADRFDPRSADPQIWTSMVNSALRAEFTIDVQDRNQVRKSQSRIKFAKIRFTNDSIQIRRPISDRILIARFPSIRPAERDHEWLFCHNLYITYQIKHKLRYFERFLLCL